MEYLLQFLKDHKDEIGGVAAICAVLISFLSIVFTVRALRLQRQHNYKSLTPIMYISLGDYENDIFVKLENHGVGPLIIENLKVKSGGQIKDTIIDFMPKLPAGMFWSTFSRHFENRSLPQNQTITLLHLEGEESDINNSIFVTACDEIRKSLSQISLEVKYKDIYDRAMPIYERKLDWFGRRFHKV